MARNPTLTMIDNVAGLLAKAIYVFMVAVLASVVAGIVAFPLVFGREFLADFAANGFPLLFIMFTYAVAPGIAAVPIIHGLLRSPSVSRAVDLVLFVSLAAGASFLLFVVTIAPSIAAAFQPMAAYQTTSGAAGGLVFWLLAGRWRGGIKSTERPA
jgi:hypothetical protein